MIASDYRAVRVEVCDCGNGVYRIERMSLVRVRDAAGVRLGGSLTDFLEDLLACARAAGLKLPGKLYEAFATVAGRLSVVIIAVR